MEIELGLSNLSGLMRDVASVAAHVERGVAAAVLPWILRANVVAGEAEIVFLIARGGFQQLILVVGSMRIVAGQAVANRWRVHVAPDLGGILIVMTAQTDFVRNSGVECHVGDIFVGPDLMAAQTAHRNGGMDELAFRLVFMALDALGAVSLRIERNGVNGGGGARNQQRSQRKQNQNNSKGSIAMICDLLMEPDAMGEHFQTTSEGSMCTKIAVSQEPGCESQPTA
jgi:hypothetical protein